MRLTSEERRESPDEERGASGELSEADLEIVEGERTQHEEQEERDEERSCQKHGGTHCYTVNVGTCVFSFLNDAFNNRLFYHEIYK